MDIRFALNIYNKPWLIEPSAALHLLDFWENVKQGGGNWSYRKAKGYWDDDDDDEPEATSFELQKQFFSKEGIVFAPNNSYDLRYNFKGFDGAKVAVIPVSGPLMKADFCGELGTASLRQLYQLAASTRSIETVLMVADSPGGTVDGTQAFADIIIGASELKNTITHTDGYCCSAMYWIGSSSTKVIASAKTDIIGSIGTMVSWYDASEANKARGIVLREFYATRSVDKNRAFNEADQGNGKMLIQEMLDPLNNVFLDAVTKNRDGKIDLKQHDVLTGKTYTAENALNVGLIDDIQSFEQVLNTAYQMPSKYKKPKGMTIKNSLPFATTLAVAKAESFEVVDGGFLATEEQLTAIEAELKQNKTVIKTLTDQVDANAASADAAIAAELKTAQDALAAAEAKATAADAKATAAEQKLAEANEKITALDAKLKEAGKDAKSFFGNQGKGSQIDDNTDEDDAVLDNLAHNRKADELLKGN